LATSIGAGLCKCSAYDPHAFNGKGGRPKGSRNRLAARVFDDLLAHWTEPTAPGSELCKGQAALEMLYKEQPALYLRLTASVLPRDLIIENVATTLDDAELDQMIEALRERVLAVRQEQPLLEMKVTNGITN
jgi:hypothetical protein